MVASALPQDADQVAGTGDGQVLWLVRHGQSTWNTLGLAQGHCDQARLTRVGIRQAWAVAVRLRDRPIGALYVSDLRRARETAAPLAEVFGLAVTRDARLRERCLGVLEGAATAAIGPRANGLRGERVVDPDARPDGGESLRDFYRRVAGFADELAGRCRATEAGQTEAERAEAEQTEAERAGEIAVVAHGGTLRVLNAYLHGIPVERMRWEPLGNGCILRSPARWADRITNSAEREQR